jgi:uncharacterized membrane protein YgcG
MSSLLEAPPTSGEIALGTRKFRRITETTEIRIRSTHRRRKVLTRAGVLAGFALAMVVYPVFGTIAPYADAAESLPGVVKGQSPTTAAALLGGGPQLVSSDLPLPTIDGASTLAVSNVEDLEGTLANCDPTAPTKGSNGTLAKSSLCALWAKGEYLQAEAATALSAMNDNYRQVFGRNICLDDSYRSLSEQYGTRASRGYLAATPGTSMHGWGLAIDICQEVLSGASGDWIRANAGTFGWVNPTWAKTSKYEPWHWEYETLTAKYYDSTWGGGGNYSDGTSSSSSSKSSSSSGSSSKSSGSSSSSSGSSSGSDTTDEETTEPEPAPSATAGS